MIGLERLLCHGNFLLLNFSILKNGHLFSTIKTLESPFFCNRTTRFFATFYKIALQLERYNDAFTLCLSSMKRRMLCPRLPIAPPSVLLPLALGSTSG